MNEQKYLADPVGPDHIDYDLALPAAELAASLAPEMARDAARFRITVRLAYEDSENYTDVDGPITQASYTLSQEIEARHPDLPNAEKLVMLLDQLIEQFPAQ